MNYRGDDYVMGHLLRRAREVGEATLLVDLITGEAAPAVLLVPEVRSAIDSYVRWLPTLVTSHRTSMDYVRSARMTLAFDLSVQRPARFAPQCLESPYCCRVDIEDDRGKVWSKELRDWWYPEPPFDGATPRRRRLQRVLVRLGQLIRSVWARQRLDWAAA